MNQLSKEDLMFLKDLGTKLKTQENLGTAKPLIFQISYKEEIYGIDCNSEIDGDCIIGEDNEIFHDSEEVFDYILEKYSEYGNTVTQIMKENDMDLENYGDLEDFETLIELLNDLTACDWEYSHYRVETVYKGEFLTRDAAIKHLSENAHHYPSDAKIFIAQSWRNEELEKLLGIIEKFAD